MANINIIGTPIVDNNILTISYNTDVAITNVVLTNNVNTIQPITFTQTEATFDLSSWEDGSYSGYYLKADYVTSPVMGSIVLNKTSLSLVEGEKSNFTIKLDSEPTVEQIIFIEINNEDITIDKTSLVFNKDNYNIEQIVEVIAATESSSYLANNTIIKVFSNDTNSKEILVTIIDNDRVCIPVSKFGIKKGLDVNVTENTNKFQTMIDYCKNTKIIQFSAGNYIFNSVDLGTENNITIKGASSSFASTMQKNIKTGKIKDTFTRIICGQSGGITFFKHKNVMLVLENIGFYNLKRDTEGNFTETEAKDCILMQHTKSDTGGNNTEKGKVFLSNCVIFGWKVGFGSEYTLDALEETLGTGLKAPEYIKQTCVLASKTRFTRNAVAINQNVDGRLIDCSFNKNDYAMLFRSGSGFTTISDCRIEWNEYNGIYTDRAHEISVLGCEFDCNGYAGLYAINNTNSNFTNNIFRRNGRNIGSTDADRNDYEKNVHIYVNSNTNCNFIGNNTKSMIVSDVGTGAAKPTNCSYFISNINCIITNNNLYGCTKSNKNDANKFESNIDCVISNNMPS